MNMTRRTAAVRVLAVLVLAAWGLCGRVVADEAHVAEIVAAVQEGVSGLGRWLSQGFDAQMFAGTDAEALDASCARWIAEQGIPRWYFKSSVAIWKALERMGVENYVVRAGGRE